MTPPRRIAPGLLFLWVYGFTPIGTAAPRIAIAGYDAARLQQQFGLGLAIAAGILLICYLWTRERRHRQRRNRQRRTYELGEQILGASSAESIQERLSDTLPAILRISRVHLYFYNRAGKTLEAIAQDGREPVSIPLAPSGGAHSAVVACFNYRTRLAIPDIERSPFPVEGNRQGLPKSLLFVPMMAQNEVVGVLELDQDDRLRVFPADEQELAQHLANQTGVALRLLDQRFVQERLSRTEKLAAVGGLISGVVNELRTPLASISDLAGRALEKSYGSAAEREVAAIAAEAKKAAAIFAHLVSYASTEQETAHPVSVSGILQNLIEFRGSDWKASGIRVRNLASREPIFVLGLQGQLEQVFLNLFVHMEQCLAEAPQKVVTIRTSVLARRLLVELAFTAPQKSRKPGETAAVLGVTRSVIAGHGGEVRLIEKNPAEPVFEVELPAAKERAGATQLVNGYPPDFGRTVTALLVEPDEAARWHILSLLSARGYRVVPVNNSDTALDLAQRLRFDLAFVSPHAPGLNWVELSEQLQTRVGGFVLIPDAYDSNLAGNFKGDGRFVLPKPVQEVELDRVLGTVAPLVPATRTGPG